MAAKTVVALDTFSYTDENDVEQFVRVGDVLPANSPIVQGRKALFGPA